MSAAQYSRSSVSVADECVLQRPQTLLKRMSSGLVNILPPLRASSPVNDTGQHSLVTSHSTPELSGYRASFSSDGLSTAWAASNTKPDSDKPCPYDPSTYHSFASIEKRRRGLNSVWEPNVVHKELCHACKTGSFNSHISADRKQMCK